MNIVLVALTLQNSLPGVVPADTVRPELRHGERIPPYVAIAHAARDIDLDGRLDEPEWQAAQIATGFTQRVPEDGSEPTERTEVRILFDGSALYIGARMYDTDPEEIARRLGRRDSYTSSDLFWASIDSYHDHRTAFVFAVNPAGVRRDEIATSDNHHGDMSWDPVWDVATRVDSLGWVAEMRIPFSQIRFATDAELIWGVNFRRDIFRKNEVAWWSWVPNTEQGYVSHFGHVTGLRDIPQPRRLEMLPYTVATSDHQEGVDPANPFNDGNQQDVTVGMDLKYGVTSDLTLDATVNPDFGQVEADPAVVNLSAFETYFEERRPFFVEGANLFQFGAGSGGFVFGAPQLFYSRRVGRAPSAPAWEPGGYVDNPTATRIIGAAKLSGKTGGWSIGFMDAVTAREHARVQLEDGNYETRPVEPLANYGVVSLRKDLRNGASGIGAMATTVHRSLNEDRFGFLRSAAYSGGMDYFHRFGDNQFALNGSFSASHIRGDPLAISLAQRSSSRYFQRPDQDYVSVDTTATSMTGYAGSLQLGKVAGNWLYATDLYAYSPGFEINDAGFETTVDRIFHGVRVNRRWLQPGRVFRRFNVNATFANSWNFGGTRQWTSAYFGLGGQLRNYWQFNIGGNYNLGGLSDKSTRGGPLMENPTGWGTSGFIGTDFRKPVSLAVFADYSQNRYGGTGGGIGTEINLRPTGALTLSLAPSFNTSHAIGMYVTQRRDETAAATYGGRYLFSELEQKSLDLSIRVNWALSPDLSIQLWAQPFIATGDYEGFKELAQPRTFNFMRYGVDGNSTIDFDEESNLYTVDPDGPSGPAETITFYNPDFSVRSLRSNLVLRWEYMPGSTLFLVWNHGRSGSSSDPRFRMREGMRDLWRDDQQNTFLIKLNYWINM